MVAIPMLEIVPHAFARVVVLVCMRSEIERRRIARQVEPMDGEIAEHDFQIQQLGANVERIVIVREDADLESLAARRQKPADARLDRLAQRGLVV